MHKIFTLKICNLYTKHKKPLYTQWNHVTCTKHLHSRYVNYKQNIRNLDIHMESYSMHKIFTLKICKLYTKHMKPWYKKWNHDACTKYLYSRYMHIAQNTQNLWNQRTCSHFGGPFPCVPESIVLILSGVVIQFSNLISASRRLNIKEVFKENFLASTIWKPPNVHPLVCRSMILY